ncbi:unnamed protein product [Lactuca virosa]|uniref:Uncharacterized protein n=1 Tax=Lactuca virosa TaxID=75947 RepID=A0AAU9LQB1_9ASTR|nr:unnamed protein product [Lactuca virosa]CAH1414634.1 unnamed protein product [Lactuca virosa]
MAFVAFTSIRDRCPIFTSFTLFPPLSLAGSYHSVLNPRFLKLGQSLIKHGTRLWIWSSQFKGEDNPCDRNK